MALYKIKETIGKKFISHVKYHDEYFKDKKSFAIGQCLAVIKQNGPTSNLECIFGMLSSAEDIIELLWASTKLKAELSS